MPGIVGLVRNSGIAPRVDVSLDLLCHLPGYRRRVAQPASGVAIGQVWRADDDPSRDWHDEQGVSVYVAGAAFRPGPPAARVGAREIVADYLARDEIAPDAYDGTFTVVLVDSRRRTITVWGDRLGGLPVYYASVEGGVAFAPEAKALFPALGFAPAFDTRGVISFLACGYCMGRTTLFRGVNKLPPGGVLAVSTQSLEVTASRHFRMDFRPDAALEKRHDAEEAIRGALVQAHRQMMCDDDGRAEVLLSGGLDSRIILALLDEIGARPRTAVSWGIRADIAKSDARIAAEIASAYGVPFRFIRYDSDGFAANARDWCRISELANDNIGWYAEGAPVLASDYCTGAAFMATGDECFGVGGWVRNEEEVRDDVLPSHLPTKLTDIITPHLLPECVSIYDAEIDGVLADCRSDNLLDRKDFLYIHGRLVSFVYSLGYYKELAVGLRRPLTAACVLDVMQRVPARYRVYKNAYVSMMDRFYPKAAHFPMAIVDSLPDWDYDLRARPELRALVLELLADERLSIPVVGDILDADATRSLRDAFFAESVAPMRRIAVENTSLMSRLLPHRVKRGSHAFDTLRRRLGRSTKKRQRSPFHTLMAIAQLSMLEQEMQKWKAPGAVAGDRELV
jgi:Asparagine synthase/Glutamine amidotransferase domain